MIKKLATLFILSATIISFTNFNYAQADEVKNKANALRVSNDYIADLGKEKFDDFWTPENEGYLNASQKEKLNELKEKVAKGDLLSGLEKTELKNMKVDVIKIKLGDAKFQELEKLIKKREGSSELTKEERARLYELDKEATGKK